MSVFIYESGVFQKKLCPLILTDDKRKLQDRAIYRKSRILIFCTLTLF